MNVMVWMAITIFFFLYSLLLYRNVMNQELPIKRVYDIAKIIYDAAMVYLRKQFLIIWVVGIVATGSIYLYVNVSTMIGFVIGLILGTAVCFFNMLISLTTNNRIIQGIARDGLSGGFRIGISGGQAAALFLPSTAIMAILSLLLLELPMEQGFMGLSMGVSLVSIFARLGGGIFTKGADVGADLVGKVEQSMPEDDPRNPAVIADNVGDNVGDCSGTSADLMESYVITLVSSILLCHSAGIHFMQPIIVSLIGLVSCIVPIWFIRFESVWQEMHRYFFSCIGAFIGLLLALSTDYLALLPRNYAICLSLGAMAVGAILKFTEYYTTAQFSPVRNIAVASQSGPGTNVIFGLSLAYESTVPIILLLVAVIIGLYHISGFVGIAFGALGFSAMSPATMLLDMFGPASDNANGLAEMAHLDSNVRQITDILDEVGNTTKALTKGVMSGASIFTTIVMLYTFNLSLAKYKITLPTLLLSDVKIICGLLLGAVLPNFFSGYVLKSVSKAAMVVVDDVRTQFRENPGILTNDVLPNYSQTINILTEFALQEMMLPTLVPVLSVILVFVFSKYFYGIASSIHILWSMIIGATITCTLTGIAMCMAGGAWDNAKKYIESGVFGGKGTPTHKAAVVGDTVGDPYKDTVGPALNSLSKLMNLVAILLIG